MTTKVVAAFSGAGWRVSWVGPNNSFFSGPDYRVLGVAYHLTPRSASRVDRLLSAFRVQRGARVVADVDWWYCPDPDAAAVAVRVARRQGGRVIFDIHEEFHGAMLDRWTLGRPAPLWREVVRRRVAATAAACDIVTGVNKAVLDSYAQCHPKAFQLRNCAPLYFAETAAPSVARGGEASEEPKPLRVMHGKALPDNGTLTVLRALQATDGVEAVVFPGMGEAANCLRWIPDLDSRIASLGVQERVDLSDSVPHDAMPDLLASCQVGLVAYGRGLGVGSLPNRLFEYMAASMAVVVPSYSVEMSELVLSERVGLICDMERPEELADALAYLRDHPDEVSEMGRRAREAFRGKYCWEVEVARLLEATASSSDDCEDVVPRQGE